MELMNKLLHKKFSKAEYKELRKMLSEENKVMLKRPGYIIGHVLIIGLFFYFMVRALGPESFEILEWPRTADVVGIVVGTAVAIFILWLILKLSKVKRAFGKLFLFFWLYMTSFGLLTSAQPHSKKEWEFAIYAALTFFGWVCCTESIKKHFGEKIFMFGKKADV